MSVGREKIRCLSCYLAQWNDRANCRRCGSALPEIIVRVVERVVERVVVRQDTQCLYSLAMACNRIVAATERPMEPGSDRTVPVVLGEVQETEVFPTIAEIERAMIVAAYEKSNRKPVVAAHLLGIGKTTLYRKLREMGEIAA
jgi:transcriptional regulator of acetoin/glycerol metabolism